MITFVQLVVAGIGAGAAFSLIGIGLVLVYRTTGVINFAQGVFAVIAGLSTATLARHMPIVFAALISIVIVVFIGILTGLITVGRRGMTTPLASLIVTIGLAFLASAAALVVFGDSPLTFPAIAARAWDVGGVLIQPQYVLTFGFAAVFAILLSILIRRTIVGHALVACADSRHAAELIGLNVRMLGTAAFALAAFLAAIGGVVLTPLVAVRFDSDISIVVNAFVAAVFGGLVSIRGAFIGGLVLGVAESLVSGYISGQYNLTIALVLMLVVMIVRSGRQQMVDA